MQRLAEDVNKLTQTREMIKDAQITTTNRSLVRIVATFESLAEYREEKQRKFPVLASLPLSVDEVTEWKNALGCGDGHALTVLDHPQYRYEM